MYALHVNSDELVTFSNKLEKLSRTAFPNAVRKTLNEVALDVKKRTLQRSAASVFTLRKKNFFKRFSRVMFVQERRVVNKMESVVGMDSTRLSGANNFAVENLHEQEYGGMIGGRTFVPAKQSRVSKSWARNVKRQNRISEAKKIGKAKGNTKKAWLAAAAEVGVGGLIFGTFSPTVFRITKITKDGGTKVKTEPVYHFKKGKKFTPDPKARGFARRASELSAQTMNQVFIKVAKNRFERTLL